MRISGPGFLAFSLIFLSSTICAEDDTAQVSPKQPTSISAGVNHPKHLEAPIILLVSFDGFRADYLDRYDLPNFQRFMHEGVPAQGLIPVFPSVTSPNHYSIVTGLYPERHGIVGNVFYDPNREEVFTVSSSTNGSWYRGGSHLACRGEPRHGDRLPFLARLSCYHQEDTVNLLEVLQRNGLE